MTCRPWVILALSAAWQKTRFLVRLPVTPAPPAIGIQDG